MSRAPTFLDRHTLGLSNWLWFALVATLVVAMTPRAARRTIESSANRAEDWLPASYSESADLAWFQRHFSGEAVVVVSWDGCTLGQNDRMRMLAAKLPKARDAEGRQLFTRVLTGPGLVNQLMNDGPGLSRGAAIARLEGALVGPPPAAGADDDERPVGMVAAMSAAASSDNRGMRAALDELERLATEECGVPVASLHVGGPPADNVAIDREGQRTLIRLAGLSGIVGLALTYFCFRSLRLTGLALGVAIAGAALCLAMVYYAGAFEVLVLGLPSPRLGVADAVLMSAPAVVYVLALSGAVHLINYYREERASHGRHGAVERAIASAGLPCVLAALTTAVGLVSLATSDVLPIKKFGLFTSCAVVASVGLLLAVSAAVLHVYPPRLPRRKKTPKRLPGWLDAWRRFVTERHAWVSAIALVALAALGGGVVRTEANVQLLKLIDPSCDLVQDYAWFEANLGKLVPMEVVVRLDESRLRQPDELAEGAHAYRMTMRERAELARRLAGRIETLEPVGRTLSAATFLPPPGDPLGAAGDYAASLAFEQSRDDLAEYVTRERDAEGQPTGAELWRLSARLSALDDVDYGLFVEDLRQRVEPVLSAYRARDRMVAATEGGCRDGRFCLLFRGEREDQTAPADSAEAMLVELLREASGRRDAVAQGNLTRMAGSKATELERLAGQLAAFDAVVCLDRRALLKAQELLGEDAPVTLIDCGTASKDASGGWETGDASITRATYTGIVPLVYKTQRQLIASLKESLLWAVLLIAGVMMIVLRSPMGGLVTMAPNVFPVAVVFGLMGWLGVKLDIGVMMTASVALGVAVDDTLHFTTWFRRGLNDGLSRPEAVRHAFERSAVAMIQTTLIVGIGMAVFMASTFTPTRQFGLLMMVLLSAALVGDLVLLPALLCGPLGKYLVPRRHRPAKIETAEESSPEPIALRIVGEEGDGAELAEPASPEPPTAVPAVAPRVYAPDEPLEPANAELRNKLRNLRRPQRNESAG
ncbi:putative efflux pump membrane transporter TtgB [Pseudobythopirellula maris]|uniref:Putative efflux pump membrane transporter TtgB n=1 Tax=Pseudobythopirellula maris TaxID=2527991 RepID=A0A5C5ZMM3_9BACT|nr:MMPL family transporter [Pseudobythopirellula maris]TWT88669.1 putative efflux pump membrane transporter TtgB [Pseudobythopirellula maris]